MERLKDERIKRPQSPLAIAARQSFWVEHTSTPSMIVVCSYCRQILGTKAPDEDASETHGICAACLAYFTPQWAGLTLNEYLNRFPMPVVAVNQNAEILGANHAMLGRVGDDFTSVHGKLIGKVMECAQARLPGGCGKQRHCRACAIRLAVEATMRTGTPLRQVPAYVDSEGRRTRLRLTTVLEGGVVTIRFDEISDVAQSKGRRHSTETPVV